ncbi:hypothetical protein ACLB2K_012350 [Fragaria x ananassa]
MHVSGIASPVMVAIQRAVWWRRRVSVSPRGQCYSWWKKMLVIPLNFLKLNGKNTLVMANYVCARRFILEHGRRNPGWIKWRRIWGRCCGCSNGGCADVVFG